MCGRCGRLSMPGGIDGLEAVFDDGSLVADAGLLLAGTVMDRLGLEALIDDTVRLGGSAGAGAGRKVLTVAASMLVGGRCIDDTDRLRSGASGAVLPFGVVAPSTAGTFLRSFTFGHVRQLDKVAEHALARAWSVGAAPAVDRDAGVDAACLESCDLVGHERHQRRDDHGHRPGLVVSGQSRYLVAQRLPRARRQDSQNVPARHSCLDDGLLQRASVLIRGFRPEAVKVEESLQLFACVVALTAPRATLVFARAVAQAPNQMSCLGKLVSHPGRHDRVVPRYPQPRQGVGQRPAVPGRGRHGLTGVRTACGTVEPRLDRLTSLGVGRPRRSAQTFEEQVESGVGRPAGEPVPGCQQVWGRFEQFFLLVRECLQGEPRVQFRIVQAPALELSVLIVLDQMVIRVAREGERVEPQRVYGRQSQ